MSTHLLVIHRFLSKAIKKISVFIECIKHDFNALIIRRAQSEAEVFKVLKSGKTKRKGWKRMVTKVTFVGDNFTRKPPKFERFIRPMGLRMNKAHVTHPELKATFCLPIIGVKKNPSSPMYTNLGVITKVIYSTFQIVTSI